MYFHVMVGSNDLEASRRFYDAVFETLGVAAGNKFREDPAAYLYGNPQTGLFLVTRPMDGKDACHANGGTIMFKAPSKDAVAAWHKAGLENGGTDVSAPAAGGLPGSTMAYLRDPTGNKIAVVAFG